MLISRLGIGNAQWIRHKPRKPQKLRSTVNVRWFDTFIGSSLWWQISIVLITGLQLWITFDWLISGTRYSELMNTPICQTVKLPHFFDSKSCQTTETSPYCCHRTVWWRFDGSEKFNYKQIEPNFPPKLSVRLCLSVFACQHQPKSTVESSLPQMANKDKALGAKRRKKKCVSYRENRGRWQKVKLLCGGRIRGGKIRWLD